jgi:flavin-dependent dehydrogenase
MNRTRVLVIGGGPAGATAATMLARAGVDVELIERVHFPRYHIGESIVPACLPILELMGLRDTMDAYGFQPKEGVYFRWGDQHWDYRFGSLTGAYTYAWQVERADFDAMLLDHAAAQGVQVHQGRRVSAVHFDEGGRARSATWEDADTGASGVAQFDYLIDASGRAGVLANKHLSGRQFHDSFKNVALWSYWKGGRSIPDAPRGATLVSSIKDGWVWVIPLRDGVHSVGVVMHKRRFGELREESSLEEIYRQMLVEADMVPYVLHDAHRQGDLRLEQDYSYTAQRFAGPGYFLAGDAACFLDPLLSTGVHLAMFSALLAAACIASLGRGELDDEAAEAFYEESYRRTYLRLLVVVAAVYKKHLSTDSYFWSAQQLTTRDADPDAIFDAFLNVVSGIEDMDDLSGQDRTDAVVSRITALYTDVHQVIQSKLDGDLTDEDREQLTATAGYWKSVVGAHTVDRRNPVRGRYVVTEPRLGVATVALDPAAVGSSPAGAGTDG